MRVVSKTTVMSELRLPLGARLFFQISLAFLSVFGINLMLDDHSTNAQSDFRHIKNGSA